MLTRARASWKRRTGGSGADDAAAAMSLSVILALTADFIYARGECGSGARRNPWKR